MSTTRLRFNKRLIEGLEPPDKGRATIYDSKIPALALTITAKGARSFYVIRRVNGRPSRVRLGGFPQMSVEQARTAATVANAEIEHGRDPAQQRKRLRASMTLGALWDQYRLQYAETRATEKTKASDKSRFDTCFADWKGHKLAAIRAADVRTRHESIAKKRGKVTANRAVELLRRLFNYAERCGAELPNPARRVDLFRETSRDRFLAPDELRRFMDALEPEAEVFRDFFKLALFTGARRGNLQAMRWSDVNLERAVWRIPAEQFKNGEPMDVPLAGPALDVLHRRKQANAEADKPGECVFPAQRRKAKPHLTEPRFAFKRVCERAGIEDLRIHDLRRTLGSWQAAAGASLPVIGRSLGHRDHAATQIYARLDLDPVRKSVNAATDAMLKAGEGGER